MFDPQMKIQGSRKPLGIILTVFRDGQDTPPARMSSAMYSKVSDSPPRIAGGLTGLCLTLSAATILQSFQLLGCVGHGHPMVCTSGHRQEPQPSYPHRCKENANGDGTNASKLLLGGWVMLALKSSCVCQCCNVLQDEFQQTCPRSLNGSGDKRSTAISNKKQSTACVRRERKE